MRPILGTSERVARALDHVLPGASRTDSVRELLDISPASAPVMILDDVMLTELERIASERGIAVADLVPPGPVIALCEGSLRTAMDWLPARPWLSHVASTALFAHPRGAEHLAGIVASLQDGHAPVLGWLKDAMAGRRVRLTKASSCSERLARMSEHFASCRVATPLVERLQDVTAALLTTAFYQAPHAAAGRGLSHRIDVVLPEESGCDLMYGCTEEFAAVRVRDPFGVTPRETLAQPTSEWRKLAGMASIAASSIVDHHHSDFWFALAIRDEEPRPLAFHMFWKNSPKRRFWKLDRDDSMSPVAVTFFTCVTSEDA